MKLVGGLKNHFEIKNNCPSFSNSTISHLVFIKKKTAQVFYFYFPLIRTTFYWLIRSIQSASTGFNTEALAPVLTILLTSVSLQLFLQLM